MQPKQAWDSIVLHCKWLGIPVIHKKQNKIRTINKYKIRIEAITSQVDGWEQNFNGAWRITAYFEHKYISWHRIAMLLHEVGHVLDYRDNMIMPNRSLIQNEQKANSYAQKLADMLNLPVEKITPGLDLIINSYKRFTKDMKKGNKKDVISELVQSLSTGGDQSGTKGKRTTGSTRKTDKRSRNTCSSSAA